MKSPAESWVVVGCLARDCRRRLPRMLRRLEELARAFRKTTVVVAENGSRDGTRAALEAWSPAGIEVVLPPVPEPPRFDDAPRLSFPHSFFDRRRIGKMVFLRDVCQAAMRESAGSADYAMLLDVDAWDFSVPGALSSFESGVEWDAVAANGLEVERPFGGWIYRDTYAYRDLGETKPRTWDELGPLQRSVAARLEAAKGMVAAESAFGGLAIYRAEAFFSASYVLTPTGDPIVSCECEHVAHFRAMKDAGFDRVFVNPRMILRYNSRLERWRLEAEMAARRLVRAARGSVSG